MSFVNVPPESQCGTRQYLVPVRAWDFDSARPRRRAQSAAAQTLLATFNLSDTDLARPAGAGRASGRRMAAAGTDSVRR